ncbi:photosynthetic complex putative assembly protein PuhB [Fulvimarina sp. 2208YS6-2-32]|uniref:Photosynthetic complex putative assembly protein PuhB n=1 Tax=Fulvimarina uroteuthidis TaxID=3098149 RepID=A0ABU5I036_9HYPH|nr:photosynthetic complex putative assembly protein PuhB [Fulvimarina sp. 2208YS6-2-32]MDY8108492.1 photosynthetic complex putative assembly protein PuhB [Fulvimarina sp. 2208YS6-2-32]
MKHLELDETADIQAHIAQAELPDGETILWQGKPDWWRFADRAFRMKWVAGYFTVMIAWRLGSVHNDTGSWELAFAEAMPLVTAFVVSGTILMVMAWFYARTTGFLVTDRRVVFRYGVALPSQLNIPLKDVEAAGLRLYRDGTGDIPLVLPENARPYYFQIWPFARPFKLGAAEPMMRAVPNAAEVARTLSRALAQTGGTAAFGVAAGEPSRPAVTRHEAVAA